MTGVAKARRIDLDLESNVEYDFSFQRGLANLFFSRSGGFFIDRFHGKQDGGLLLIHGYGNVFEKNLAAGEVLDVEPGAWLWKDSSVRMDTVTARLGKRTLAIESLESTLRLNPCKFQVSIKTDPDLDLIRDSWVSVGIIN